MSKINSLLGQMITMRKTKARLLLLLIAPFLLNDFANIYIDNYIAWLIIDFLLVKILPLFLIASALNRAIFSRSDLGLNSLPWNRLLGYSLVAAFVGVIIDQMGWRFLEHVLPLTQLGNIPYIDNPFLRYFDIIVGLAIVGFLEEVIFRAISLNVIAEYVQSRFAVYAISSLLFGLIHWSLGLHAIINTAFFGLAFCYFRAKMGSVWPLIIAHYLVDVLAFSGLIPNDVSIDWLMSIIPF